MSSAFARTTCRGLISIALRRLGFTDEADQYVEWLSGLLTNKNEDGSLQIMYTIHGEKDMEELELSHLDGHVSLLLSLSRCSH